MSRRVKTRPRRDDSSHVQTLTDASVEMRTRNLWIISAILFVVTFAVYSQVKTLGFVGWDDDANTYANPYLNPVTASNILHFWQQPYNHLYTPVTYTVWAIIAALARGPVPLTTPDPGVTSYLVPAVFHIASVMIHAFCALFLFFLLRLLVRNDWAAGAGALAFAVHPVQVESVAWVTGMNNLTAGFFSLLALWLYICYACSVQENRDPRRSQLYYAGSLVIFALALLAKPTTAAIPLAAWMMDYWILRRPIRQCTMAQLPWLGLAIICVIVTQSIQTTDVKAVAAPLILRPVVAGDAITFYLFKLAWPLQLGLDYGRPTVYVLRHGWVAITCLVPCALAALLWWRRKRIPVLVAASGMFVAGVLPVVGLVPYYFHEVSVVADRYLYLAMPGLALAIAWLLSRYRKSIPATAICAAILSAWAVQSALQVPHWRDSFSLFEHAVEVNPDSGVSHYNLGTSYAEAGQLDKAVIHLQAVLRIQPKAIDARDNLAKALNQQGKTDEAIANWRTLLTFTQGYESAYMGLGAALDTQGKTAEATSNYRTACTLDPKSAEAQKALGTILAKQGIYGEALDHLRTAVQLKPDFAGAYSDMGTTLYLDKKTDEAIAAFNKSVELQPNDADAQYNLGVLLSTQGKNGEAATHLREALRIRPDYAKAQAALASAERTPALRR